MRSEEKQMDSREREWIQSTDQWAGPGAATGAMGADGADQHVNIPEVHPSG